MNRNILILLWICFATTAHSQVLFRIVTLSYGVNIDGNAVAVGDYVKKGAQQISIPKGGYLGIATVDGDLHEFTQSITAANVISVMEQNRLAPTGASHRPFPMPLQTPLGGEFKFSGDSLFVLWDEVNPNDQVKGIEYSVKITDEYEQVLIETTVKNNWLMFDVKPFFKDTDVVIISVRSKRTKSSTQFIISNRGVGRETNEKLRADLERLANHNDLEMLAAIYELNKFYNDRNFVVYKMITRNYKPSWLFEKYINSLTSKVSMK